MPNHPTDPPVNQTAPNAPSGAAPAPDSEAGTTDAFSTLPRRRFWRNRPERPRAIDFWWQEDAAEAGTEKAEPEKAEPED